MSRFSPLDIIHFVYAVRGVATGWYIPLLPKDVPYIAANPASLYGKDE